MPTAHGPFPPLSPVLIAGLALRPLPPRLLQPFLDHALDRVLERHPDLFDRLAAVTAPIYLIDVIDLPFGLVLTVRPPGLRLVRRGAGAGAVPSATIRAALITLLDLMQSRLDGDALFFSRDLAVEGDTEAVVALRNAIDAADLDLVEEMLGLLGPLAHPVRHLLIRGEAVFRAATADLETLRQAAVAPVMRRSEAAALRLDDLERQVAELRRRRPREARP